MSDTYNLLLEKWKATSLSLEEVREHYFEHIKTEKHLRALINRGEVNLPTFKNTNSRKAPLRVRLTDLAAYLDERAKAAA